jgi:hypothetical protein
MFLLVNDPMNTLASIRVCCAPTGPKSGGPRSMSHRSGAAQLDPAQGQHERHGRERDQHQSATRVCRPAGYETRANSMATWRGALGTEVGVSWVQMSPRFSRTRDPRGIGRVTGYLSLSRAAPAHPSRTKRRSPCPPSTTRPSDCPRRRLSALRLHLLLRQVHARAAVITRS